MDYDVTNVFKMKLEAKTCPWTPKDGGLFKIGCIDFVWPSQREDCPYCFKRVELDTKEVVEQYPTNEGAD